MAIVDEFSLRFCRAVVADPDPRGRHQMKSDLYTLGFRELDDVADFNALEAALQGGAPDLVVADLSLGADALCQMFRDIRHHEFGADPFVPVVVSAENVSAEMVAQVIDSGADHFLVKPWPDGGLDERVQAMIFSRKPFVVTSDYIGPDRRLKNRDGDTTPQLAVPNPLHAKIVKRMTQADYQGEVDHHAAIVNERKLLREADQVLWLANRILPVYSSGEPDQTVAEHLARLRYVTEDMTRRCENTHYHDHAEDLAGLARVVNNMLQHVNTPDPKDLRDLEEYSRHIANNFR